MLRALIFDCDGVLVDSEPAHLKMFQKVLLEEGIELSDEDYFEHYLALDDRGCFTAVCKDRGKELTEEALADLVRRKAVYFKEFLAEKPATFPGVIDFVNRAAGEFPMAIASGALRHEIQHAVQGLGIAECFFLIVSAEDVKHGKPNPEAYLTACARLNNAASFVPRLKESECLVIEDSVHGIHAAKAAGMWCLAVANSYSTGQLSDADWVVERLDQFDLQAAGREIERPD